LRRQLNGLARNAVHIKGTAPLKPAAAPASSDCARFPKAIAELAADFGGASGRPPPSAAWRKTKVANAPALFILVGVTLLSFLLGALGGNDPVAEIRKAFGIKSRPDMIVL
jgi:hypothetical protein